MTDHNHITRDIKPLGQCPGCDAYHQAHPPQEAVAWTCEAYGPDGVDVGAVCFFTGQLHHRICGSQDECSRRMAAERQRVFDRIHEAAAAGDPTAAFLAGEFTSPDQLLGGGQESS